MSSGQSCDHSHRYGMTISPCSGNGKCINGLCYCYSGWTGRADYQVDPHYDCDIYINGVIIESSFLVLLCFILIISSIRSLSLMKFKYSDIGRDAKVSLLFCYICNGLGDGLYSITKTINPYIFYIGSSNYLTAIGSTIFISFTGLGWCYFFLIFTNFLQGYSKMVSSEFRGLIASRCQLVNDYIFYTLVFPVIFSILDLLAASNPHKADYFSIGTLLSMVCMTVCCLICSHFTIAAFVQEIGKYLSTVENDTSNQLHQIRSIHKNFKIANYIIVVYMIVGLSIGIIVSSLGYIRRKTTYVQVFLRACCSMLEIIISLMIAPSTRETSSSKKRSSTQSTESPKNVNLVKVYISNKTNESNDPLNNQIFNSESKVKDEHV